MKFAKIVIIANPKNAIGILSSVRNLVLKKKGIDTKNKNSPVKPYRKKLRVKGSISLIINLVKTNVDPPSAAEKEA
tara:strand:- start:278 stop:505 length:228 start_codon:yes stop_codon:yes gene_type:complete